jgi:hypothetical protein
MGVADSRENPMRGLLIAAALVLASCTATDIELPPAPPPPAAAVSPAKPVPQTEVRPVELPDLAPAGGMARAEDEPLARRRSGIADEFLERRLDCNDEPTPSDRDVRNAFLRRCPP